MRKNIRITPPQSKIISNYVHIDCKHLKKSRVNMQPEIKMIKTKADIKP